VLRVALDVNAVDGVDKLERDAKLGEVSGNVLAPITAALQRDDERRAKMSVDGGHVVRGRMCVWTCRGVDTRRQ
jgi:hypothetical protein